jgi:transcription antitermination factor NusG
MDASLNKKWYAVYTRPRNEKKAYSELDAIGIETFLPLIKNLKQWSDRKKWVEEPLFRSYLFVHITRQDYYKVLNTYGIVRYITFEGKAVVVPPRQILAIRQYVNAEDIIGEGDFVFEPGDQVEIYLGPLKGLTGQLIKVQGRQKVKIEIESIGHSITLTIPQSYLRKKETAKNKP